MIYLINLSPQSFLTDLIYGYYLLQVKASIFAAACISELADDFAQVFLAMLVNTMTSCTTLAIRVAGARVFAKLGCSHSMAKRAYKVMLIF